MKVKKLTAGIVAAVMAVTAVGTPLCDSLPIISDRVTTVASAETYEDFEYEVLDDGTVEITGYNGTCGDVDIPSEIDGKSVTSIGSWAFKFCDDLRNITIPDGVTSIGDYAFHSCHSLKSVTMPNGVKSISNGTFFNCPSLIGITIPDSVTSIGNRAFEGCTSLEGITIPNGVKSIGDNAFAWCVALTSITIPDSLTSIGSGAFCSCSVTEVKVAPGNSNYVSVDGVLYDKDKTTILCYPCKKEEKTYKIIDGVTSIDGYAFNNCQNLVNIIIPDSVTSIGESAFNYCINLTDLTIPGGVTSIEEYAFYGCKSLTSITIPNGVTSIGENAFCDCASLNSIVIPGSVTSIGYRAFYCKSLKSVTIPASVTYIGDEAFGYYYDYDDESMKIIEDFKINYVKHTRGHYYARKNNFTDESCLVTNELSDGTLKITNYIGNDKTYVIPAEINGKKVTEIGGNAFSGCAELISITIPDSITTIWNDAIYNCTSLKEVAIPASVTYIGSDALGYYFDNDNYKTAKIDGFKINYVKNTQGHLYAVENGFTDEAYLVTNELDDGTLKIAKYVGNDKTYVVPAEINGKKVTEIGISAFGNCTEMTSVTIPDSVTNIDWTAFYGCTSLETVTIPESVISIGNEVFYNCTSLKEVTIPAGVTSIGSNAFGYYEDTDADEIKKVDGFKINYVKNTRGHWYAAKNGFTDELYLITNVLDNGTLEIVEYAGNISEYVVPSEIDGKAITVIGEYAYYDCNELTSVVIPNSVTDIEHCAFKSCDNLTSVTIPDSVKSIGSYAFDGCISLKTVTIPANVSDIGDQAFGYDADWWFDDFKIYCYSGTAGEQYAKDNEFDYEVLDCDTHQYGDWVIDIAATCTTEGKEKRTCAVCGRTETQIIPATAHDFVDGICKNCNKTEAETIQSKHPYDNSCDETWTIHRDGATRIDVTFTEDTYTESGYDYIYIYDGNDELVGKYSGDELSGKTITVNSDTVKIRLTSDSDSAEYGFALDKIEYSTEALCDHSNTEIRNAVSAGCTTEGYTGDTYCVDCDELISSGEVIPATGHTEVIDEAVAATCTKTGLTEGIHCSVCDAIIKAQETIPAKGHTEVVDKAVAATCTKTGLTEGKHCSVCNAVIKAQETVPAKGHTEVIDKAVAATCTKTGLTEGKHCSACNAVIKAQETVPATGKHSFGNWKITKAATCTATGTKTRTCSACGKVETATIAKTAHQYVDTVVNPTYTAQGYTLHKCSVCGTSYKDTYTAKLTLAQVTGVKLAGRAADALRVNWTKNADASGYIVEMYQGNKWVRVAKITNNSTTTFRKAGLSASTDYKFRVKAYKMEGKTAVYGAYSATVAARTNPSVVKGAKLTGRAADALRINWTKNASADGYIVEMYQGNKWVRAAKITNSNTTTFRKEGLKASSVYKFRVRAYKMSGKTALYGNYSATVTARTNPSIVKGVKIAGKAKDALRVNWTKNTSAQGYIVEMYKGGKWVRVAKITNNNTTTFRKSGLAKNTTYKFRVKAYYMSGKTALYGNYGSVSGKTAAK